jgi:hypothetical protein
VKNKPLFVGFSVSVSDAVLPDSISDYISISKNLPFTAAAPGKRMVISTTG